MKPWPRHPVIYEINTWVWLGELGRRYGKSMELATVPEPEWDAIGARGFDAVWFMGVWERSPAGIEISMRIRASSRISAEPSPTLRRPTTSAHRTACAATWSTNTSAGHGDWRRPARVSPNATSV